MQVQEWHLLKPCLQEKFCPVFDKLRPTEKKIYERKNTNGKHYNPGEKIHFKNYKFGKAT